MGLREDWSQLPSPALHAIFEALNTFDIVGTDISCGLVCRSWYEAAVAATDSIVLETASDADSLQLWLQQHGGNLTQLHFNSPDGQLLQLPCPNLVDLQLQGLSTESLLQLAPAVAALPKLESLTVKQPASDDSHSDDSDAAALPAAVVQQLGHVSTLQDLDLIGGLADASLEHVSCLTQLSHLGLYHLGHLQAAGGLTGLQQLPGLLSLTLYDYPFSIISHQYPCLSTLAQLQSLDVTGHVTDGVPGTFIDGIIMLQPSMLSGMTGLQHLSLARMKPWEFTLFPPNLGRESFLQLAAGLQQLTHLSLVDIAHFNTLELPTCDYAALSAAPELRSLEVWADDLLRANCEWHATSTGGFAAKRARFWQGMFAGTVSRSSLTQLSLRSAPSSPYSLQAPNLECVIAGCPALLELNLTYNYDLIDCELTGLGRLIGLSKLCIEGGKPNSYSWASSVGVQLTALQELELTAAAFSLRRDRWLCVPVGTDISRSRQRRAARLTWDYWTPRRDATAPLLQLEDFQEACAAMQALTTVQCLTRLVLREEYVQPHHHPVLGVPSLRDKIASAFGLTVDDTEHDFGPTPHMDYDDDDSESDSERLQQRHTVTCTLEDKASPGAAHDVWSQLQAALQELGAEAASIAATLATDDD